MTDVVDNKTRSRMMSGIKGKNTIPELKIRRFLHKHGFRYGLHKDTLPGKPDLVMPKYKLVIFINGCYWHRHDNCIYTTTPKTRTGFWSKKLSDNKKRDQRNYEALIKHGWRVLVIWECGLKHSADNIGDILTLVKADCSYAEWPFEAPKKQVIKVRIDS